MESEDGNLSLYNSRFEDLELDKIFGNEEIEVV